jgi:hypothetical protein
MTATPNNEAVGVSWPMGSDREVLLYLMQQFDCETWQCPQCGHAEDTATTDSALYLRDYLAKSATLTPSPAQGGSDRLAIRMLVAAGFVTETKANEALQIAHGFASGPVAPPPPADAEKRTDHVAWALLDPMGGKPEILTCKERPYSLDNWLPLYTTPPASVPVSELLPIVQQAIERAQVFDDGSDGADAESARSVVAILTKITALAQEHGK